MTIRITRTYDIVAIDEILTHPKIYPHISDDSSSPVDTFTSESLVANPHVIFVAARKAGEFMGVFMFVKTNAVSYEVHSAVLPEFRGKLTPLMARGALKWMFDHTECLKVDTKVPSKNRLAKKLAEVAGMTYEGTQRMSFLKDGKLYDQLLYGITKEEF